MVRVLCGGTPTIHQRLRDRDQGNAVCDAMVNPHHHGGAALVVWDQMELPQGVLAVQRLHGEFRELGASWRALLLDGQRAFWVASLSPDGGTNRMPDHQPGRTGSIFYRTLHETRVLEQPFLDALAQSANRIPGLRTQTPTIIIRFDGESSTQPCRIDLADAFAIQTQGSRYCMGYIVLHGCRQTVAGGRSGALPGFDSGNHRPSRTQ